MKKNNLSFVITVFFLILLTPVFGAKNDVPQWQQDINDRSEELEELQKQNGYGTEYVKYTEFPKTADDLSFSARVQLEKEGLEPYKNLKAYKELDVKNTEEWCPDDLNDPGCEKYKAKDRLIKTKTSDTKEEETKIRPITYVARIRKRSPLATAAGEGFVASDGDKCYAVCGQSTDDDVNNKLLEPVMKKFYCARTSDGLLVENDNRSNILEMSAEQLKKVKENLPYVQDQNNCENHFWRNYILFIGKFNSNGLFIELEEIFLDD